MAGQAGDLIPAHQRCGGTLRMPNLRPGSTAARASARRMTPEVLAWRHGTVAEVESGSRAFMLASCPTSTVHHRNPGLDPVCFLDPGTGV